MPHLSFLWNRSPEEIAMIVETIPMQSLEDLFLAKDFRRETLEILRKPCRGDEISMRQPIIMLAAEDNNFRGLLGKIREEIGELSRLTGIFDRSEMEEERILMFPAVMKRYFSLVHTVEKLEIYSGRPGEIGASFKKSRMDEIFLSAEKLCGELLASRRSGVLLTVSGANVRAHEGGEMLREKLENIFRKMSMEGAIPAEKHPVRATPSIVQGYAEVYRGYLEGARGFLNAFRSHFLEGKGDIRSVFPYGDEIAFLLEMGAYFRNLNDAGYPLSCPAVSEQRETVISGLVDASLAKRGIPGNEVVPNDVYMEDKGGERLNFYILSGANGGGKTTYLRACTLAALFFTVGCPITAKSGRIMPFDNIFTHFPANESFERDGRFADETARADEITELATKNSFAVFNETFSGTDEKKSEEYSARLAGTMAERGVFGIYVTHIHSITGGKIPTLAAVIDENDANRRTYKIRRVGGTASSFAADILEKYGLDALSLAEKMKAKGGGSNV